MSPKIYLLILTLSPFVCLPACLLSESRATPNPGQSSVLHTFVKKRSAPTLLSSSTKYGGTLIRFKSQTWKGQDWEHWMLIFSGDRSQCPQHFYLQVAGNGDGSKYADELKSIRDATGCPTATLMNVPNQPLFDGKKEDELIAYTFHTYLKTGDDSWPLLFPMVKSVSSAIDLLAEMEGQESTTQFILSGASKRGWTTWLSAGVDPRVSAIAPRVFDFLDFERQTKLARSVWGAQSEKLQDYTKMGLIKRLDEPRSQILQSWVDPIHYQRALELPKLVIIGTNDDYWALEAVNVYWDRLRSPKALFQGVNQGHHLNGSYRSTLTNWIHQLSRAREFPQIKWQFHPSGAIEIHSSVPPSRAIVWQAQSTSTDFRKATWTGLLCPSQKVLLCKAPAHTQMYRAHLVELRFTHSHAQGYSLFTAAKIAPPRP